MLARLLTLLTVLALSCASTQVHAIAHAPGANQVTEFAVSSKNARRDFFAPEVKGNREKLPLSAECTKEKSFAGVESSNCRRNYLRARYYEPGVGRFVGMDPFGGFGADPQSLHRYTYAHSSPVTNIDPSGELTIQNVTLAIRALGSRVASLVVNSARVVAGRVHGQSISAFSLRVRIWFVRTVNRAGSRVPKEWGRGKPNKKGAGWRWSNKKDGVRIDKGSPKSPQASQRVDHVVVRAEGRVIGRNGKPISGSVKDDPVAAHIPLSEWLTWTRWFHP